MHIVTVYKTDAQGVRHNYYRLCESYRTATGQPRKRMLCALGYLEELPTLRDHMTLLKCIEELSYRGQLPMSGNELIDRLTYKYYDCIVRNGKLAEIEGLRQAYRLELERQGIESVNLSTLQNINPREVGAEHVCVQTLRRLGIMDFLLYKGWDKADADFAIMQIASRAIYPVSELRTVSYLLHKSSLCEMLGVDPLSVNHHRLYRSAMRLYDVHQELEDWLHNRVCTMFDISDEILLFDLTNTYFEGRMQACPIAKFGRSKEKRSDCRLVVLAAVVNSDGILVRTRIFEGNTGDCTVMEEIMESLVMERIRLGRDKEHITVVMDAGISTKGNLDYLKANNFHYVTVALSSQTKYSSMGLGVKTVLDNKKQEIRLERVSVAEQMDTFLLVDSQAKTLKERGMYERSCQYFEEGLKAIACGISKKGGTKKLDKVCERLGRLKNECPSVWKDYSITYQHNEKNVVTEFVWQRLVSKSMSTESKHGKYLLRTNMDETKEENIWFFYNVIRTVEETFRCLKSDLDIRPVFHKGEYGTKAHLNLAVLAYWVVSTVRYQLKDKGLHESWTATIEMLQTHKIISTRLTKADQSQVEIRQCTEPNEQVVCYYQCLKLSTVPIKRRKFVVHPDPPNNKENKPTQPSG